MPPSLENPFRRPFRSKREAEEISDLLLGKGEEGSEVTQGAKVPEDPPLIELSTEEQDLAEKADIQPWTREEMEEWAEKFDLDDDWLDINLEQNPDGTWTTTELELDFLTDPTDIPKGLVNIYSISLDGITSPEKISFPEGIHQVKLNGLHSAEYLSIPDTVDWIELNGLTSSEYLVLPKGLKYIKLNSLETIDNLVFPNGVNQLVLNSLLSTENLVLPESLEWLYLDSLQSIEGLKFPADLKGLSLGGMNNPEEVDFPESLQDIGLSGLASAEGIYFHDGLEQIDLNGLTTIQGLELPSDYSGDLFVNALSVEDKEKLKKRYPNADIY